MLFEYLKANFDEFFDSFIRTYYRGDNFSSTSDVFHAVFENMEVEATEDEISQITDLYDDIIYEHQDDSYETVNVQHTEELTELLDRL